MGLRLRPEQVPALQEAAKAVRENLQRGVDFVIVHEAYRVAGPSPAAALNQPTVLAAVAAWERFVDDLTAIGSSRKREEGAPRRRGQLAGAYLVRPRHTGEVAGPDETLPGDAARVLTGLLGDPEPLGLLRARVVYNWTGATPRFNEATGLGLREVGYRRSIGVDDAWDALTIGETVYQAVKLRNAIAHSYLPRMDEPTKPTDKLTPEDVHWLNMPSQMFWRSDKSDGLSVQAGCARGVLALFIQLVDQVIVALAGTQSERRPRDAILRHRMPGAWFGSTYTADNRRGLEQDVHLWRGKELLRLDLDDLIVRSAADS